MQVAYQSLDGMKIRSIKFKYFEGSDNEISNICLLTDAPGIKSPNIKGMFTISPSNNHREKGCGRGRSWLLVENEEIFVGKMMGRKVSGGKIGDKLTYEILRKSKTTPWDTGYHYLQKEIVTTNQDGSNPSVAHYYICSDVCEFPGHFPSVQFTWQLVEEERQIRQKDISPQSPTITYYIQGFHDTILRAYREHCPENEHLNLELGISLSFIKDRVREIPPSKLIMDALGQKNEYHHVDEHTSVGDDGKIVVKYSTTKKMNW